MHYKHDNLPDAIRQMMLSSLYESELYKILERKAAEDTKRAISKLRSVIKLELFKQEYLTNALKNFGSDEAVDKFYNDNHKSLYDIVSQLSEKDNTRFDNSIHAMLFAVDILDTYVGTINELVHKAYPDMDFAVFDDLISLGRQTAEALRDFHKDRNEGYEQIFADEADKIHDYIENERMPVFLRKLERYDKKNSK